MKRTLIVIVLLCFPQFALATDFFSERAATWNTFKTYYIEAYKSYAGYGLVFDPSVSDSSKPDQGDYAVSEGIGYGLLLAVLQNDQVTFDKIFSAANTFMWNGSTYDWKVGTNGDKWGTNGATDADEDIALALIFADKLQSAGTWSANNNYGARAQALINMIYDKETINSYVKPGDVWGGPDTMNLSYFAPAWYRVFDEYEHTNHDWQKVIDTQYTILLNTGTKYNGLIPDWQDQYGNQVNGSWGMRYDGIRVPWRIAIDAAVNNEGRATQYLDQVIPYIMNKGGASKVQMYSIPDGATIEYHNELTVGMWAAGAVGSSNTNNRDQLSAEFKNMYMPSIQAFSNNWNQAYLYYFNQSLAMLGSAVVDGSFQKLFATTPTQPLDQNAGTSENAAKQKYRKKGKIQKKNVVVKVVRQNSEYIVRLFTKNNQVLQLLKKKKYNESSLLKRITIKGRRVHLHHNNGLQKIVVVKL